MKKHIFLSVTFVALLAYVNVYAAETATPPKAHKTTLHSKTHAAPKSVKKTAQ